MMDLEKALLVPDDHNLKRNYLKKMYFLLGLHFTVISATSFCLHMTFGVRPFVQQHAYLVPLLALVFLATLIVNKILVKKFCHCVLSLVLLTASASLAVSAVCLYLDTENGFLISGIVAISWFCHFIMSSFNCIRLNFLAVIVLTPFFLLASSLFMIETIGLFSFDIFINAPTSYIMMLYILVILHKHTPDYTEETLIGFRAIYP